MPVIIQSTKSSNLNFVDYGDIITYQFVISNIGDVTINNTFLIDTLPSALTFTNNSVFINGVQSLGYNPIIPMTLPLLNPGQSTTVSFESAVNPIFPIPSSFTNIGNLTFNYTVTSTNFSKSDLTNSITTTLNKALLVSTKTSSSYSGLNYPLPTTVVLSNIGNVTAFSIVLREVLDPGMTVDNSSIKENGISISGDLLAGVSLNNIAPNSSLTISYNLLVNSLPSSQYVETFSNTNYAYNVNPLTTTISSTATTGTLYAATSIVSSLIRLTGSVSPSNATLNDTVTYTFTLSNIGNSTGTSLNFIDTLPNSLTFNNGSVYVNGINYPSFNPNTSISIPNLIQNGLATITFTATVNTIPSTQSIVNSALLNYGSTIPNSSIINSLTTISNIIPLSLTSSILTLQKYSNTFFVTQNSTITYTLVVKNLGNIDVFNSILFDTIPIGLSFIPSSLLIDNIPSSDNPNTGISLNTIPINSVITVSFNVLVL